VNRWPRQPLAAGCPVRCAARRSWPPPRRSSPAAATTGRRSRTSPRPPGSRRRSSTSTSPPSAICTSLLEAHVEELFRRLQASAAPGQPGEERLRRGIDAFLSFVEEHREAWRALFRDAADPDVGAFVVRVQAQATAVIAALIAADPEAPEGGERAIEMHAAMLSGALQSLANWWHDHQEVPRAVLVDRAMDFCWVGIRAHTSA
jgi:hypothetical protein